MQSQQTRDTRTAVAIATAARTLSNTCLRPPEVCFCPRIKSFRLSVKNRMGSHMSVTRALNSAVQLAGSSVHSCSLRRPTTSSGHLLSMSLLLRELRSQRMWSRRTLKTETKLKVDEGNSFSFPVIIIIIIIIIIMIIIISEIKLECLMWFYRK